MKVILNTCYGGFEFSKEMAEEFFSLVDGKDTWHEDYRYHPQAIALIEKNGSEWASSSYSNLVIANIPDDATDHIIENYDGVETILYVRNGKIYNMDGWG